MKQYNILGLILVLMLATGVAHAKTTIGNELGVDWDKVYISDYKTYWNFVDGYYYHNFTVGKFGARINHGTKFGNSGNQYQVEAYPILTDWLSLSLTAAGASGEQTVYPNFDYTLEAYFNVANQEFSLGRYESVYSMFDGKKIITYTGSIGVAVCKYFAWARFNLYSEHRTAFLQLGLNKYFSDEYNYIGLGLNRGKLPTIGDIFPLNRIELITQTGVNLEGQFALVKTLYLKWYIGYDHQVFPHHHLRNATEGSLGLLWRF